MHYLPGIRLEQGGVVRTVLDWCGVFAQRGHRVRLFCYQGDDLPPGWLADAPGMPSARVVPAPRIPGKRLNRAALKMIDAALADTDVLHLHAPWLDGNRQIAALARRRKVPYLVTIHGMLDDWSMNQRGGKKRLYMALFGRRFLDSAAAVHLTAEGERRQAIKWFSNPSAVVLPPLTDLSPFEHLPGRDLACLELPVLDCDDHILLFLSRLHEKKGVDRLIRAMAVLRQRGNHHRLILAGTGDAPYISYLQSIVDELKLNDVVHFVGLVTGQTKLSLYRSADVFVLPTLQENYGIVLIEALACGTPVVTTRGTDIWPEVQIAGGLITDGEPASIADAVTRILAETDGERGPRGRQWVFEHLATDALAGQYESLYRGLK